MRPLLRAALGGFLLASSALASLASIEADRDAVLKFGPRVAGSPANEQARTYLEGQFRALGYETRREAFSYPRFDDLGSDVKVTGGPAGEQGGGEQVLVGRAMNDSAGGVVTGALVRVPGVGTEAEFAGANVRGKVAVVLRGQIPFVQKARNAQAAGALGLIVVNNSEGDLRGTLGERLSFPVLGVSATVGAALGGGQRATLSVRVREGEVRGFNVVAFKPGVTGPQKQPQVLFGAHMDSVQGAPGANDNLSGTLSVLELARRSVNTPLAARAYFVLFDGEEDGLLGSRAFVKDNPALVQGLKAMLNFDMVGVGVTPLTVSGDSTLVEVAGRVSKVNAVAQQSGGSDHVPFAQAGVPALFFHTGIDANYHQPGDTVLDPALLREAVDVALKIADGVLAATPAN